MTNNERIIVCDECNEEFPLKAVKINEAIVWLDGVPAILVYFTCPKCNKIYRVSIQDKRYYELVQDLERAKERIRKNYGSNNEIEAKRLNDLVFKKKQRIANYMKKVNEKFNGTFTFKASENNQKEIIYLP